MTSNLNVIRKSCIIITSLTLSSIFFTIAHANKKEPASKEETQAIAREAISNIVTDNAEFTHKHTKQCFEPFLKNQTPRITFITCSDSRVHTYAFDETPDNDLFVIRNIGNQIESNDGSVEYGIHHLNTPVLMIVGHTGCGAVKAALMDTSGLEPAVRKEVEQIHLSQKKLKSVSDSDWISGVRENVNSQVKFALSKYKKEVTAGNLVVVGAIYDLHNVFNKGSGKFIIINIDGVTSPKDLERNPLLQSLKAELQ